MGYSYKKINFILLLIIFLLPSSLISATLSYQYDNINRLTRVERSDGAVITYGYDNLGNRLSKTVTAPISMGDINGDSQVDLTDVLLSLQVVSGIIPTANINAVADVNNDQKIGIEEAIYMMQVVSGFIIQ